MIGLAAAGFGTAVFLRDALMTSIGAQVETLARTDAAAPLLELSTVDGDLHATPVEKPPTVDYFVAVYSPVDGHLIAQAGGRGGVPPVFPAVVTLETATLEELQLFSLFSADGETEFRAARSVQPLADGGTLYPQVVAVSAASVNRTIAAYAGIYTILALVIIVASAFLTRWLVTLTFRSLGQVETTAMSIAQGDFSQRMTDIEPTTTEVGRLKTALNAMLDRVDAALEHRDATVQQMRRFIGDASHELRTPLVTVRGYAELYRMGAISGDDDTAQAMDRIESEAKRMGLLVEDLLALARLDERRDVVIAPVDLRTIARDAALDVRATAPHRPVTVIDTTAAEPQTPPPPQEPDGAPETAGRRGARTPAIGRAGATLSLLRRKPKPVPAPRADESELPPPIALADLGVTATPGDGIPPIVLGDENRVRQVVANLLGNARRFTAEDSPIELAVGVDLGTKHGWIEVIDHGDGVPDQIKEKIFQRFWRADTSRARETGGTGLGLSIVASIVEALQGAVSVHDTPGGGATFRVALPLSSQRPAADQLHIKTQPIEPLPTGED